VGNVRRINFAHDRRTAEARPPISWLPRTAVLIRRTSLHRGDARRRLAIRRDAGDPSLALGGAQGVLTARERLPAISSVQYLKPAFEMGCSPECWQCTVTTRISLRYLEERQCRPSFESAEFECGFLVQAASSPLNKSLLRRSTRSRCGVELVGPCSAARKAACAGPLSLSLHHERVLRLATRLVQRTASRVHAAALVACGRCGPFARSRACCAWPCSWR